MAFVYINKGGLGVVWAVLELNMTLLLRNEFYQRESQLQSEQKQLSEVVAMQLSQKQGQSNIQAKGQSDICQLLVSRNALYTHRYSHTITWSRVVHERTNVSTVKAAT